MREWIAGGALALGACVTVLLMAQSNLERDTVEANRETLSSLRTLARLEVESRELALASRNGYLHSFDRLVETDRALRATMASLEDDPQVQSETAEARRLLENYRADIERFKRARSRLRNSLRVLPARTEEAVAALTRSGGLAMSARVAGLAAELSGSSRRQGEQGGALDDLETGFGGLPAVDRFLMHARMVDESGTEIDARLAGLRGHALVAEIARLVDDYSAREAAGSERLGAITLWAAALSTLLLVAMGLALGALRSAATTLRLTNEGLAEEVRVRSAELATAQKLESIGQLAAGIAHEINTPAQFVSDNLEFVSESVEDLLPVFETVVQVAEGAEASGSAAQVQLREQAEAADLPFLTKELPAALLQSRDGIARVAEIVRAMKDFSHPGAEGFQNVDLNRAIESTVIVARNEWKYCAELELDLEEGIPSVPCHAGQINQSVLNILVNAAHAIDANRPDDATRGAIWISTRQDGDGFARIEIRDSGGGVPAEVRSRIFDPFFTTKEVGRGTGQGLAIAYQSVVENHGGTLRFDVEEGIGTTFVIRLPLERSEEGAG